MEEEKQSQGALCKEAAAKAAVAVEQTKILLQIASIQNNRLKSRRKRKSRRASRKISGSIIP